ncbi:GntR family transcriptional regulator [Tianweitania sp. BSSL-BM11]|uniref:GntR family transcriptional regulator n=1 Tax=Tianweitania aestuarii TaxID=2814886 RepID=A0ABS5RYY3_9HYPH|nr:GntR family transcriptional regulator [Tianweitania aestuarii]MBS9722258.1 GntR family transcriptional regulator [Tianweitania aestuarii]
MIDDLDVPVASKAYHALEEMIVTLALEPGSTTTESLLVERVGLGRTPVREAIQRLAWEGFLIVRPRTGLLVAPLDPGGWIKVLEARRGIEIVLARSAALSITPDARRPFLQASEAMYAAAAAKNDKAFLVADKRWDEALAAASDNPFAVRVAAPLQTHSRRFWYRFKRADSLAQAANRHIMVIEAVLRGDADGAADAMQRLMDMLQKDAEASQPGVSFNSENDAKRLVDAAVV